MTQVIDRAAQLTRLLPSVRISEQMNKGVEIAATRAGCRKTAEYVRILIMKDLVARGILTQEVDIEQAKN